MSLTWYSILLLAAFVAAHVSWRAGAMYNAQHRSERPMLYSSLGVVGEAFAGGMPFMAGIAATSAVVWGVLRGPWYAPFALFVLAGLLFGLIHGLLLRFSRGFYGAYFMGLGPLFGFAAMAVTQFLLWGA